MKDSLNDLFRERFQGHEAPVDPATWQVIEARLIAAGPASDPVNELFRERFQEHEVEVDASVWNGISSQLGHPVASSGLSGTWGWMAAGVAGVLAIGAVVVTLSGDASTPVAVAETPVKEVVQEAVQAPPLVRIEEEASATAADKGQEAVVRVQSTRQGTNAAPPLSSGAERVDDAPVVSDQPATQQAPEVVERIISSITEKAKQEVATAEQSGDSKPAAQQVTLSEPSFESLDALPVEHSQKLFLPNTFTPNNDGINDTYMVPNAGFSSMMLRVYSVKTNQLVFATNTGEPWTGANCEDGMYLVAVEALTLDGRMLADGKVVYLNRTSTN